MPQAFLWNYSLTAGTVGTGTAGFDAYVEDITEALWGTKVSPATVSEPNKKAYVHIEEWRNRPLQGGKYPYVYVDGIYLRRYWGGEFENVSILVALGVNEYGYREVIGAAERMK